MYRATRCVYELKINRVPATTIYFKDYGIADYGVKGPVGKNV
jgi:hypothetical protein